MYLIEAGGIMNEISKTWISSKNQKQIIMKQNITVVGNNATKIKIPHPGSH